MPDREYDRVSFRGGATDRRTMLAVLDAEKALGQEFVVTQGSYSSSVAASGGTHDGGGVLDLNLRPHPTATLIRKATRALRDAGLAAWWRTPPTFPYHWHVVDIGNARLSPAARSQVAEYRAGGDGLLGARPDPQPYRPAVIKAWSWTDYQEDDMPLSDADLDAVADRVWSRQQQLPPSAAAVLDKDEIRPITALGFAARDARLARLATENPDELAAALAPYIDGVTTAELAQGLRDFAASLDT